MGELRSWGAGELTGSGSTVMQQQILDAMVDNPIGESWGRKRDLSRVGAVGEEPRDLLLAVIRNP
jgi:hypothetical protein